MIGLHGGFSPGSLLSTCDRHACTAAQRREELKSSLSSKAGGRQMNRAGEKPGRGYYACRTCGRVIYLRRDTDVLPTCPECKGEEWEKLS
jgi:hypothetical protein